MAESNQVRYFRPDPIPSDLRDAFSRWVDQQLRRVEIASGTQTIVVNNHETKIVYLEGNDTVQDGQIADLEARATQLEADMLLRTRWMGKWAAGTYEARDQVHDDGYLMIANKQTTDRPAPQGQGEALYIYQGTSPQSTITAKNLKTGVRYTITSALFLEGWRAYTVTGNYYNVYLVVDPDGANELDQILSWEATATGWDEFTVTPVIIPAGTVFELWLEVIEPAPTPTTFSGNWNYLVPNNETIPLPGEIAHANKLLDSLRVHKTDDDGGDRSVDLATITVGDIINGPGGIRWVVQVITDNGTWVDFTVAPASQGAPAGVFNFVFEVVVSTPIMTVLDPDYWLSNANVTSYYRINNAAPVNTEDAYGIDAKLRQAYVSPDWDYQSDNV